MNGVAIRLSCVTIAVLSSSAAPAAAASPFQLSLDGVHWTSSISDPLFDPAMRWVPGDSESATFFVRNEGGSAGDLTVDVLGSSAGKLLDSGRLHVTAKGGGGTWTTVSTSGRHRLLSASRVPDGTIEPIRVDVSFDPAATNPTRVQASHLSFRISLTDSNAARSGLPDTGAPELRWYAALGATLIGFGLALVIERSEFPGKVRHV